MREVIDLPDHRTIVVIEPALTRPELAVCVAQVPLPDHHGLVANLLEGLWQQSFVGRQPVLARGWNDQGLQAVAKGIAAGHECRTRGRAHWLGVELFEPSS